MKTLPTISLLAVVATGLSGCSTSRYDFRSTYANLVEGKFHMILDDTSEIDGAWSGSSSGRASIHSGSGSWSSTQTWTGNVTCEPGKMEALGHDLFDGLRMDVFARGFEVNTDDTVTFLRNYVPGANPAIHIEIEYHDNQDSGTLTLKAYPTTGNTYSVRAEFDESSG